MPAQRCGPWPRLLALACLSAPFLALLCVPLYARVTPRIAGLPFFYGYQLGWVLLTPLLMYIAYRLLHASNDADEVTQEGVG